MKDFLNFLSISSSVFVLFFEVLETEFQALDMQSTCTEPYSGPYSYFKIPGH